MQLNWGEYGQDKFIYMLDPQNVNVDEYKNTVNSRYEKIYYSGMENGTYSDEDLERICKNNFIKLVIDVKYQFNNILNMTEKIRKFNPITYEIEYLISLTNDTIAESTDVIVKSSSKDNRAYLIDYVNVVYDEVSKVDESIDKTFLLELADSYYRKSQVAESERQERE